MSMLEKKYWFKPKGYPFVPDSVRKTSAMDWLRKIHAWIGVWGAVACVIFGFSTIALQHPELIPSAQPRVEYRSVPVGNASITSAEQLGHFVKAELGLMTDFAEGAGRRLAEVSEGDDSEMAAGMGAAVPMVAGAVAEAPARRAGGGNVVRLPTHTVNFAVPGRSLVANYVEGNDHIEIAESHEGLVRIMYLPHLGRGDGFGWTVLGDIFSGSLILVCLTGFLLWNVFAGSRVLGIGVFALGLFLTLYFVAAGV